MQKPPLIEAAEYGDIKRIKELIKNGVNVNTPNANGFTAITIAAMNNNLDMLRLLLSAGANPYIRAKNNQNAVDWAHAHDNKEMLRLLEPRLHH